MFGPALTLILALVSSTVIALPMVDNVYKRSAASLDPSSTDFPFFFPDSVYEVIPHSGAPPSPSSETVNIKAATDYIFKKLSLGENDFKVVNSYTDLFGISHVYGTHIVNGASVSNHQAAAHAKDGEVTCFSTSFGTNQHLAKRDLAVSEPKVTLSFEEVSSTVSTKLEIPVYSDFEHTLEYVAQPNGEVVYTYKFQLRNGPVTEWIQVWCSTTTGEVVQAINFSNKASYRVIKFPRRDLTEKFIMVARPEFKGSSPKGWTDGKVTGGNNIITRDPHGKAIRAIRKSLFKTKFNSKEDPASVANIAAAGVNLFYASNMMHDISYQYGFTEQAGNFQTDNFGRYGKGNDPVTINVLGSLWTNNANFLTPPDGQPGVMNMYPFTTATPNRTPGLDNSVIVHEYIHGITNRLTGGAAADSCLKTTEAQGMGEGWSDAIAMMILAKSSDTATTGIPIGVYVKNNPAGLRTYLYTTDMKVNPLTYGDMATRSGFHTIGEVWASILWEVYWSLVTKHGFAVNLYKTNQSEGNIAAMKIIMTGLTIQQCNPFFFNARDAIILSDIIHHQGANKCELYRAFAKRGLGFGATRSYKNDFTVPPECQ
ncbi:hypothetical protein BASA60_005376 [Batrachochytrium salamandrivorans]|nr:hypothetical protein BASA60_005376 [Batrachochytrium salamandrivorans]